MGIPEDSKEAVRSAIAVARTMEGGALLDGRTDAEIMATCNGLGAQWADSMSVGGVTISDIINLRFRWAIPASIIHDVRYSAGGNAEARRYADEEFHRNLKAVAGSLWNPRTWLRRREALAMYRCVRVWGYTAFRFSEGD